jgi:hypothetical protein
LALLAIPAIGRAQTGSVGTVTIALTLNFTAPAASPRDENGKILSTKPEDKVFSNMWSISKVNGAGDPVSDESLEEDLAKIGTFKYGNKEALMALWAEGMIPGASIAGWTIVKVSPMEDPPSYFAVHATHGKINIDTAIIAGENSGEEGNASSRTYKLSNKTTYTSAGDPIDKSTETKSWTSRSKVHFDLDATGTGENALSLDGVFSSSGKLAFIKIEGEPQPVYVIGAEKLDKVCGAGPFFGDGLYPSLIEGSISFGAGKAIADTSVYFDAP